MRWANAIDGDRSSMVELQIVVLAVAGSSPVGHPPTGRERSSTTLRVSAFPGEATFVELAVGEIIPSVTHRRDENVVRLPCALAPFRAKPLS